MKKDIKKNFNILIVADFSFPNYLGGSAQVVYDFFKFANLHNFSCKMITRPAGGKFGVSKEDSMWITWKKDGLIFETNPLSIKFFIKLISLVKKSDFILIHHPIMGVMAVFYCLLFRKPYIYDFHGPFHDEGKLAGDSSKIKYFIRKKMQAFVCRFSQKLVVHSNYMKKIAGEFGNSNQIELLNLGIDAGKFENSIGHCSEFLSRIFKSNKKIACLARRLTPRTGVLEFLKIIQNNKNLFENWIFVVSGIGELQDSVESYCDSKSRIYVGYLSEEEKIELFQKADLMIVPSIDYEGFGLVTVEAALAGTPSIVSSCSGGASEFLEKIDSRLIYNLEDPQDLFRAMNVAYDEYQKESPKMKNFKEKSMPYTTSQSFPNHLNLIQKYGIS